MKRLSLSAMARKARSERVGSGHQRGTAMDGHAGIEVSLEISSVYVVGSNGEIV
jgi:hypothetical protein